MMGEWIQTCPSLPHESHSENVEDNYLFDWLAVICKLTYDLGQ